MCILGSCINLMPLYIFKKLGLENVKLINITLQMADRSLFTLHSVIDYVLVKVGKYIFLVDFIVLDVKGNKDVPIILSRPLLATRKALINVQSENLFLKINYDEVKFDIKHNVKFQEKVQSCYKIKVVGALKKPIFHKMSDSDCSKSFG